MTDGSILRVVTETAPRGGFQFSTGKPLPRVLTPEQCAQAAGELLAAVAQPDVQEAHPSMSEIADAAPAADVARVAPDDVLEALQVVEDVRRGKKEDFDEARDVLLTLLGRYFASAAADAAELDECLRDDRAPRRHGGPTLPQVVIDELEADPDTVDGSSYTHVAPPDGAETQWTRRDGQWVMDASSF